MEMTIDIAIDRLEDLHFEQDNWEYEELTEDCLLNRDALRLAIDTMRKYQKIEDIYYHQSGEALENSLRAVIKNEFDWRAADDNT